MAACDIHALFCHYNALYFHDVLGACVVSCSQSPSHTGTCHYTLGSCDIYLSEPLLKLQSTSELKNTLLHEMIHAFLWIKNGNKDRSDHGLSFQAMMKEINSSSLIDHQKPDGGYNITTYHGLRKEGETYKVHRWICKSCGDMVENTRNREPSACDCLENMGQDMSCGNSSCQWHRHKKSCSGNYIRFSKDGTEDEKMGLKGTHPFTSSLLMVVHGFSAEPELQEENRRNEGSQTTRRSCKAEGTKETSDVKMSNTISNFFQPADDVNRNSESSLREMTSKKPNTEALKDIESEYQSPAKPPEIPRRVCTRTRMKHKCHSMKKRKFGQCKQEFTVMSAWLGMYVDEEVVEEVEPLINIRTERRKKLKLLKDLKGKHPETEDVDMTEVHEIPMYIGNDQRCASIQVRAEDRAYVDVAEIRDRDEAFQVARDGNVKAPNPAGGCGVVKGQDVSDEGAAATSSSVRDNIVDISD